MYHVETNTLRSRSRQLNELAERLGALARRADGISSASAGLYRRGGVGSRPVKTAAEMHRISRQLTERAAVLEACARRYEKQEEELIGKTAALKRSLSPSGAFEKLWPWLFIPALLFAPITIPLLVLKPYRQPPQAPPPPCCPPPSALPPLHTTRPGKFTTNLDSPKWKDGCFVNSYAMALEAMGAEAKNGGSLRDEIYQRNGGTVSCRSTEAIAGDYGFRNIRIDRQPGMEKYSGMPVTEQARILKETLASRPPDQQAAILNLFQKKSQFHMVMAYLDETGELRIRDPGFTQGMKINGKVIHNPCDSSLEECLENWTSYRPGPPPPYLYNFHYYQKV